MIILIENKPVELIDDGYRQILLVNKPMQCRFVLDKADIYRIETQLECFPYIAGYKRRIGITMVELVIAEPLQIIRQMQGTVERADGFYLFLAQVRLRHR